jgi:uncharacterized protein (TIGR02145 family)
MFNLSQKDASMKMIKKSRVLPLVIVSLVLLFETSCKKENSDTNKNRVTDFDGNIYDTVVIGNQVWMLQNLKTTHFNNGDPIPEVADSAQWEKLTTGAYCNYNNDPVLAETYGHLYNWYVINDVRKIAPKGWHVPTIEEWITLRDFLGGASSAGGKMKESGTNHWSSPNAGASNQSGFTGLPAGSRMSYGTFSSINHSGIWWGSDALSETTALSYYATYAHSILGPAIYLKQYGLTIRCIKD